MIQDVPCTTRPVLAAGSGVLAIAALKLGAAEAFGADTEPCKE